MKINIFGNRLRTILKWQELISPKDWFEKNIELIKGKVRGLFKTSEVPHLYKVFELIEKKEVNILVLRVASQTQKTTFSLGMLMYWIDTDYHDMFYMIPRANQLKKFLSFKIAPFLDGCKVVKKRLQEYSLSEKERKNSYFYKTDKNLLAILSANDTKTITTKYGIFDEASEMDIATIEEALERFKDYGDDWKVIILSTQIDEDDAINYYYNTTEVKYMYHLKCVHCGDYFVPTPEHLKILSIDEYKKAVGVEDISEDGLYSDYLPYASRRAYLECPICNSKITNKEKNKVIANNECEWFAVIREKLENGDYFYKRVDEKDYFESVGVDLSSMLSKKVSIKKFAEKELKARLEKHPSTRQDLYEKFYAGWWNLIYKSNSGDIVKKNDVLNICNEYEFGIVPDNVCALHMSLDLQKDRLYYEVDGVEYSEDDYDNGIVTNVIEYGELYAGLDGQDFKDARRILEKPYYDKDGNEYKIMSIACDIKGFSQEDADSRSNEMLNFIFEYAKELKDYGVTDYDNFVHPCYGVDSFRNPQHEAQGYKLQDFKRVVDGEEITIKGIIFSNKKIKDIHYNMIKRTIQKAKGAKEAQNYKGMLKYVTKEMLIRWEERQALPPKDRREKHSLEAHLTSEVYTYVKDKNDKLTNKKAWQKRYPSARNDFFDTGNMIIAQIYAHDTYRTKKPKEQATINLGTELKDLMK